MRNTMQLFRVILRDVFTVYDHLLPMSCNLQFTSTITGIKTGRVGEVYRHWETRFIENSFEVFCHGFCFEFHVSHHS